MCDVSNASMMRGLYVLNRCSGTDVSYNVGCTTHSINPLHHNGKYDPVLINKKLSEPTRSRTK